jgi:hypothetical protein
MIRSLAKPAMVTVAALAAMAATAPSVGAAPVGNAARQLVWQPTYLAHVPAGWILSATAPAGKAAWAIGRTNPAHGSGSSFLLHWNGKHWRKSGMPVRRFNGVLLASSSAGNVWMFGWTPARVYAALRWNGRRWLRITMPGADQLGISGAAVISPTDVWVVAGGNVSRWNGHGWSTTTVPIGYSDEEISGYRGNVWIVSAAPDTGAHVAFRLVGPAWHAAALPRIAKIKTLRLVVASSGVWLAVAGSKTVTLHLTGGRWHELANPGAYLPIPLATYGRAGIWDDPGDVWTGHRWISAQSTGGSPLLPTALTSVPGSTESWLFGSTLNGPEVLRSGGQ